MNLTQKALRKLGLGDAASRLLSPLAVDRTPLPPVEEARAMLTALRPDAGSSALRAQPLPAVTPDFDVDVIIPVYNAEQYLHDCLDSVFSQQTRYSFRVIAVDDGSSDGSGAILDACSDPRLTVIHQENRGAAAARNRGILSGSAAHLFFLDADDLMTPGCLQTLLDAAAARKADLVEAGYIAVSAENKVLDTPSHFTGERDPRDCNGFPPGKLWSRSQFSAVCFPEGYGYEDSVLAHLLLPLARRDGLRCVGLDFPSFRYRIHEASTGHSSRGNSKSLDSLWVALSLFRDRQALGLESDRAYYEYLLNMLPLTWRRTQALGEDVSRAVFVLQRDFLMQNLAGFSTERDAFRMLEDAVRAGDFGRYRLFCSLH